MKPWVRYTLVGAVSFVLGVMAGVYFTHNPVRFGADVLCPDGEVPDKHGCCYGEIYTDMGDVGFNCCPEIGGDCYPPIR